MSDEQLARFVQVDRIDVLVDLTGHIAGGLRVFARRPAPVQVTYLGYQNTTGLRAIDWRLTDAIADAPGAGDDEFYAERRYRLPRLFFCYRPWDDAPPVAPQAIPPPDGAENAVVFGSFNSLSKISRRCVVLWARVLRAVPEAKLAVLSRAPIESEIQAREWLEEAGVGRDRIEWLPGGSVRDYLARFAPVDVALDTTPFRGPTTTCDALWMGVPVVTLAEPRAPYVSRMAASVLANCGLGDLVAGDEDAYVAIATQLARDPLRRRHLRATLRQQMLRSAVCDATAFARDVEAAYRQMWADHITALSENRSSL